MKCHFLSLNETGLVVKLDYFTKYELDSNERHERHLFSANSRSLSLVIVDQSFQDIIVHFCFGPSSEVNLRDCSLRTAIF